MTPEQDLLAAYLRKAILSSIDVARHYMHMGIKDKIFTQQEKSVLNKLLTTLDVYYKRRYNYALKNMPTQEVELQQSELDNELEKIANFTELALLARFRTEDENSLLYAKIEAVIIEHNRN